MKGKLPGGVTGGYDFVDVRDVADGVIAAAEKGRKGECYILSNRFVPIPDLMKYMQKATGGPKKIFPLLLRQLLHRREVGRDASGDHLDRWNLNHHPRTGFVLKPNPHCIDAGRVFRVYVRTLWYLCVDKSRFTLQCLDIVEFFFFSS